MSKTRRSRPASERDLAKQLASLGWEMLERNMVGHMTVRHVETGKILPISSRGNGRTRNNLLSQLRRTAREQNA